MPLPRLYGDLAWVWPFLSPPDEYGEEAETFVARFRAHGVADGGSLLHLGSGGGSIDWHLKRRYRVTGLDLSPDMIAHARSVNPEVEYLQGDMRQARLGRRFDAALLHDAMAYLTSPADLHATCETAAAHLGPGGVLVVMPEELRSRFRQYQGAITTREQGERSVTTIQVDFDPHPDDDWFEETFVFLIREAGGQRVEVDTHRVGLFNLTDVVAALETAGFTPSVSRWELSDLPEDRDYPLITALKR